MIEVTQTLAEQIADASRLEEDDDSDATLLRLTRLAVELVPGGTAAALTVEGQERALTFAASDPRVDDLHNLQFTLGEGPAVEALRRNQPQHVPDTASEHRWPAFCEAAIQAGFCSCLMLPLRTDRRPAGALSLYGQQPGAFRDTSQDLAVLFAAQGGTAVRNAALYQACRKMVDGLHTALGSRAVIEQAKGILQAKLGVPAEDAFRLLSRKSQDTNRKVRDLAAELVHGEIGAGQFRPGRGAP